MLQADLIVSGRPRHAHAEHPALGPERIASSWPTSDSWVASSQSSSLTTAKQQKKIPQHDNCHGLPLDGIGRNTHHRHRPAMLTFWLLTTSCLLLGSLDTISDQWEARAMAGPMRGLEIFTDRQTDTQTLWITVTTGPAGRRWENQIVKICIR